MSTDTGREAIKQARELLGAKSNGTLHVASNRVRISDIFGIIDSLGEDQWETVEQYQIHGIQFSLDRSPLADYLAKRFNGLNISIGLVRFENATEEGGRYNAVRLIDMDGEIDLVVRIPIHVKFVEDYWQDMIDSGPATEDEDDYNERMRAEAADQEVF